MLPLIEAKMIHHFDHRWATYEPDGSVRDVTLEEKSDPNFVVVPRYWVAKHEVDGRLAGRWDRAWLLGWRDICRSTDERTTIAAVFPRAAVGNKVPLAVSTSSANQLAALAACLSSLALDYVSRQKLGSTTMNYFVLKQLPVLPPGSFMRASQWSSDQTLLQWVTERVCELSYTTFDMTAFATDICDEGERYGWAVDRRIMLRAELDAAYFYLYGLDRAEVDHVLSTFPILRRKEEGTYGEYRTRRLILETYDLMATAMHTGVDFQSRLDPPPGSGSRHVAGREVRP